MSQCYYILLNTVDCYWWNLRICWDFFRASDLVVRATSWSLFSPEMHFIQSLYVCLSFWEVLYLLHSWIWSFESCDLCQPCAPCLPPYAWGRDWIEYNIRTFLVSSFLFSKGLIIKGGGGELNRDSSSRGNSMGEVVWLIRNPHAQQDLTHCWIRLTYRCRMTTKMELPITERVLKGGLGIVELVGLPDFLEGGSHSPRTSLCGLWVWRWWRTRTKD